jgi:hypothetical protein
LGLVEAPTVGIHTRLARVSDEGNEQSNLAHSVENVLLGKLRRAEPPQGFDEPFGRLACVAGEEVGVERSPGPRLAC